jgi:Peptidase family M48
VAHDFELKRGLTVGDWLHQEIVDTFHIESEQWAVERVTRVAARLQAGRSSSEVLEVVVPWIRPITAFTAPGRWIYVSRRLLERCPDDETAAFVIAHEIAHHDLGHLKLWPDWMPRFAQARGGAIAVAAWAGLERRLYGPERECDADRHALDLCVRAGYDPHRCLRWFDIMEHVALDLGDQDLVFGPDEASDAELMPEAPWLTKARIWAWQRTRGYLPIRDRRAALQAHLTGLRFLRGAGTARVGRKRALPPHDRAADG